MYTEKSSNLLYGLEAVFFKKTVEMHCEFSIICLHDMEQGRDNNPQVFLCSTAALAASKKLLLFVHSL